MKKYAKLLSLSLIAMTSMNVYACGEIKDIKSNVGTVTMTDSSNYLITIPEGTESVVISADTDYQWVENYGPRKISTKEKQELKVNGNACGYGIYTYFLNFKTISNLIAENIPTEGNTTPDNTENTDNNDTPTEPENIILRLSKLEIEGINFEFDPEKLQYEFEVEADVDELDIKSESAEGIDISVSDNAKNLEEGLNVITITLTSNDKKEIYTLNVTKLEKKSDNNFLANIIVEGYQLNFDPTITDYTIAIKKENVLKINVITESELASYIVLGNSNLADGSSITIRVTAEDGSTKDYTLNIVVKFDIMDYWIYIAIVVLIILLIIILLIMKKKKNTKKVAPPEIQAQENTAGLVQEVAPQNTPIQNNTVEMNNQNITAPTENVSLEIIEPTNIETPIENTNNAITEDSPTEVFKL